MTDHKDVTENESWQDEEPIVADLYAPASEEVRAAARAKIDDPEVLYQSLVRALRRRKGFGILFLQCTPAKGQEICSRLEQDLHKKRIGRLTLTKEISNLFTLVRDREDINDINVLFIEGIDKSLAPYIKSEIGRNDYYKLEVLPPILANVNLLRDNFREQFPHVCFVFVVPPFALKYFMYRALDFFSWHSGIWRFTPDREQLEQQTEKALAGEFSKYAELSEAERSEKVRELQNLIDVKNQSNEKKAALLTEQGKVLASGQDWLEALRCFEEVSKFREADASNQASKGFLLSELDQKEEAIAAYEAALTIKPNYYEALYNKGINLSKLGRYEEAIAAYDATIAIKPNNYKALYNKGIDLGNLGQKEEAIAAYDAALAIKPDSHEALNNKGIIFGALGQYKKAIAVLNQAIAIASESADSWYNKACYSVLSDQSEESLICLKKAIELSGTDKYIKLAKTDTDFDSIRDEPRFQALISTSAP